MKRRTIMSSEIIREVRKAIIQETYKCFRKKEKEGWNKSKTISEIEKCLKKEIKENAD